MATQVSEVVVPGTLHLYQDHGTASADSYSGSIVLQPQPSTDPEDPLNWTRARKLRCIGCVYLYSVMLGIAACVQYSCLLPISLDTGITFNKLNLGTGLMFLFMGWGCLIWQPIAHNYGRRGAYILSTLGMIGPMVWTAYTSSASVWLAHRALLGLFICPVETLCEVSVSDLFFAHERGTYMAIYVFSLAGSNFLAPFFAGFVEDRWDWHAVIWFGVACLVFATVFNFFFMEDTTYFRHTVESDSRNVGQSEKVVVVVNTEHKDVTGGNTCNQGGDLDTEKSSAHNLQTAGSNEVCTDRADVDIDVGERISSRPPYIKRLRLFARHKGRASKTQLVMQMVRAFEILIYFPIVLWCGLLYGLGASWYAVINATVSAALGSPPYNFSAKMVGVAYLSPFLGAVAGAILTGPASDKIMLYLARRNNGVREPEQRLWMLLVGGVLSMVGLLIWGVGISRGWHYMIPIFFLSFATFGMMCSGSLSLSYTLDSYKELASESMVSIILVRNTLGFGFNYAINPWIDASGFQNTFIAVSILSLVTSLTFLAFVFGGGKALRKLSAKRYWYYVETHAAKGQYR
ncbi:hypothetical protein B0A52_03794 [Exophiala mesophila]|uniref:Major facilitator superfamily (MFS) profile domain-containing protein n=1 Tax=Exophiala mesophila TaxID=212818 RepID=A0A438N761_EXOME|nr:hypothetical protein B0A52_03794 [Exophiala mesophila]